MILDGKIYTDCGNEQAFKISYINRELVNKKLYPAQQRVFCVETEETVGGFPDVLEVFSLGGNNIAQFYEFKFTKTGIIQFQATQPSFYKQNKQLEVQVVAFNAKTERVHKFPASEIFNDGSEYKIDIKGRINLLKVEEKLL